MVGNKDIYDTADEALEPVHLVFVDYDDRLMDEQVEALMDGDLNSVYDTVDEAFWEQRAHHALEEMEDAARAAIRTLITDDEDEEDAWWEFRDSPLSDELRLAIEYHDESNPVKDLARNTPDPLVQWVPEHAIELDVDDEEESAAEVSRALSEVGLPCSQHNVEAMYSAMANCFGPTEVRVLFTVDLSELLDPSVTEVRLKDPILLLLNPYEGSGMDTENMRGKITVPRDEIRLDSALGYGSWDNIAGVVTSAYTVDAEYVRLCRYRFEGTDTDGTDFYWCESHGSIEPSHEAHCGEAEEPAYAMLIEDKEGSEDR